MVLAKFVLFILKHVRLVSERGDIVFQCLLPVLFICQVELKPSCPSMMLRVALPPSFFFFFYLIKSILNFFSIFIYNVSTALSSVSLNSRLIHDA